MKRVEKKIRAQRAKMTAGFVVGAVMVARRDDGFEVDGPLSVGELQETAAAHPELFPEGLTTAQARWLLDNPDLLVNDE